MNLIKGLNIKKSLEGVSVIELVCKHIAALGFFMVAAEVFLLFGGWLLPSSSNIILPLTVGGFCIGYVSQGLVLLFSGRRKEIDRSWEGNVRYFSFPAALPCLAVCALLSFLCSKGLTEYFYMLFRKGVLLYFDSYSLLTPVSVLILFAACAAGIYIQFFPYYRIITVERVVVCTGISLLCYLLSFANDSIAVCYMIYMICAVIVMNQSYVMNSYGSKAITRLTDKTRFTGLRIVLLYILLTSAAGILISLVVRGAFLLIKMIILILLFNIMQRTSGLSSFRPGEITDTVNQSVLGENQFANISNIIFFMVLLIAGIVAVIALRSSIMQSIIEALSRWFEAFISFFLGSDKPSHERQISYIDTEESIDTAARSAGPSASVSRSRQLTLRSFGMELASRRTDEAKLGYSYTVMIRLLAELNTNLHLSDTPRELSEKIQATMAVDSIAEITRLIEQIKYAERSADPNVTKAVLRRVCAIVEKRLS